MKKFFRNLLLYFNYYGSEVVDISKKPIPCVDCGACCSYFRVKFDLSKNPQVPIHKVVIVKKEAYMKGAYKFKGRCEVLTGTVGKDAKCSMYEQRPDLCAAFPVWLPNGKQNPRCIKAREYHGLKGEIDE